MSIAPTNAPSVVVARPRPGTFAPASFAPAVHVPAVWSKTLVACNASMSIGHGDTSGTTESKGLTPGHLMGVLT